MSPEERSAIVIGGNMAGLTIAYLLGQYGYRTTLIERAPFLGGIDGSFPNGKGRLFDFGMHALDHMRSEFVSNLLSHAVDGEVRRLPKKRAIVLRGHVIPYNAPVEDWPQDLRALMKPGTIVDDLGGERPTRKALGKVYGSAFADMVIDDSLASTPSDARHLEFGVDEAELMENVYPWFFPGVAFAGRDDDPHHRYQSRVRKQGNEHVIYPRAGGFAGFVGGLARKAEAAGVEILLGAKDLDFDIDRSSMRVRSCSALGREFSAPRVYWCAPPGPLRELLGDDVPSYEPDTFVLGSFQFQRPVSCDFVEFIASDPSHPINRGSFPGKLHGEPDDLVQLEFAFPKGSDVYGTKREYWLETWLGALRGLGMVQVDNPVVDFDLKCVSILYNSYGIDGQPIPDVDLSSLPEDSNLRPVLPTVRKVNINTRLPQYLRFLAQDLTRE